jgi:hypothetical protein
VDEAEARAVLGVAAGATPAEVRSAYRALLLRHHPDHAAEDDAAARTRQLTEAHAALRAAPSSPPAEPPPEVTVDGATLSLVLPPDEAFLVLLDAAADLGEVTYVDPEVGLLDVHVAFEGGGTASLVVSLQGRATGTTDAFCTVADLGTGPVADAPALAALLAVSTRK